MTPTAGLGRVRVILLAAIVGRALAWGFVASASLIALTAMVDIVSPLSLATRELMLALVVLAGFASAAALLIRDRAAGSRRRVALWIEERFPSLQFQLISAVEMDDPRLAAHVDIAPWVGAALRRAALSVTMPLVTGLVVVVALLALPRSAIGRVRAPHSGDSLAGAAKRAPSASRLEPLVALIEPPAYTHRAAKGIDEPSAIQALVGSIVTVHGRGDAAGIYAMAGQDSIAAARDSGGAWSIRERVGTHPGAVRLVDRRYEKIITIEPVTDAPPAVTLTAPARDTVLRAAHGRIPLSATITDDIGLASASFEVIVSSGEGETFKFRSASIGGVRATGSSFASSASLPLDSLHLQPGDILHVRAAARDNNDVTGPGVGYSETRAIRIARPGDYDSVAVAPAPPSDEDKSVIGERTLILLAEALEKQRPSLRRDSLVRESQTIAADQKRLRRSVGDVVFSRLGGQPSGEEQNAADTPAPAKTMAELLARADSATSRAFDPTDFGGDEAPVVAVNQPLLDAYNAMWDASSELEIGDPGRALPHMRRALAAIERARQAERVYLHGGAPQVVVDVSRVRLQGKERGTSSVRAPGVATGPTALARAARFERIVELVGRSPAAAIDSLLVFRIDALASAPELAAALGRASGALRRADADAAASALAQARRALAGGPIARDSLSRWGLVP